MALLLPKVQEIAKDFKLTSKELIEQLEKFGHTIKGPSEQLTPEQLGLIFDIVTNMYDIGDEVLVKPEKKAEPEPEKAPEPVVEEKPEVKAEVKPETKPEPEKKPEKKAAPEKKSAPKKEVKPPAPIKKKKDEPVLPAEDLSDEDLVIKTEQTARYVDTRSSTVELETIETRERLEDMARDNIKPQGGRNKKKKRRTATRRRRVTSRRRSPKRRRSSPSL